jgi:DNA polymerase
MTEFKSRAYIDLETYNETSISVGLYKYAETVEITLFAYALDDEPVEVWDVTTGKPMPACLRAALLNPEVQLVAHNAAFERICIRHALKMDIPIERWFCTMAQSFAHSMPGSLGGLGEAQGLKEDERKHKIGNSLVLHFCKPKPKNQTLRRATRITHPVEWAQFIDYCAQDVAQMRTSHKKLPMWNYKGVEMDLWRLDQKINDKGILVDRDFALAAVETADREKALLKKRGHAITNGEVESLTKRDQLLAHLLAEYGVDLPNLQAATLERRIEDPELPEGLRELLRMRLDATTTSVAKYKRFVGSACSDGRLRGTLQFCGASRTGRWAGRLAQLQNLPRPKHKTREVNSAIELTKAGVLDLCHNDVMPRLSSCVRGTLIAQPGHKLVIADLSNIEGRVLAWLAGEEWKLQAFRDFDAGTGHDLYALAYAKAFGVTPEAVMHNKEFGDGSWRQIGKVMELALGYEGGVGAFLTFAAVYGIDLEAMAEDAATRISKEMWGEAAAIYDWTIKKKRSTFGLSRRAWIVCEAFKRMWRNAHPNITAFWRELDDNVRKAIATPGVTFPCRKVKIRRDGAWLRIALPSGRALCYPAPRIDDKGRITYLGTNQYTRKWGRLHSYGGKKSENATQAVARDVMAHGMLLADPAGYEIETTVHDELITETPDTDEFTHEGLAAIMSEVPVWAPGLPLAAAGFETYRYRKD